MFALLRPALVMMGSFTLVLGIIVPLGFTALAQFAFPRQANGSLIERDGQVVGSELLAQGFEGPRYFHPRASNAGQGYDGASSGASNLGPTSAALLEAVQGRLDGRRGVAPDAVTMSGSGLDPHISPENALSQIPRIATARGVTPQRVLALVEQHVEGRTLGVLGEPRVNVLRLNLALDAQR
ncbi:potassium-transporting ATPase subunit KdpC [Rhodovarius crocodyli]|uniref:Potassium-transporting ATPase KdpC subunit n=1 Tax=Rhodovarius crocodyli TaxID=1979269 RepID=A0A437LXB1_9PROT|nr:potassium-transporting ATPase subunit KdpC [Rhodovarius crocodyli]RVT90003.1 potassium-transporting ATPase subunit KdpC [Rhodovarius crocodyli]